MKKIRTHYDNLKVSRDAPEEVIRAAYRSLSQKYHPDRNPANAEAERIMLILNTAYVVLTDPEKRKQHDAWIAYEESSLESIDKKNSFLNQESLTPYQAKPSFNRGNAREIKNIEGCSKSGLHELQRLAATEAGMSVTFTDSPFLSEVSKGLFGAKKQKISIECPIMVFIPPGKLLHLSITKPFLIGRYPVTNAEFSVYCESIGHEKPKDCRQPNYPVRYVSWWDARSYCEWLSERTKQIYRLPEKAEWEYACRAGTVTRFNVGNNINPTEACYGAGYPVYKYLCELESKNPGCTNQPNNGMKKAIAKPRFAQRKYAKGVVEVDRFGPNHWGLKQMHGNVNEWVLVVVDGNKRATCGGSYFGLEEDLESAEFIGYEPGRTDDCIGFRLVRCV